MTAILDGTTIHTDLYTKPTDTHQYLSPESCHPKHYTTSIPYSQSLRLRRICSRVEDFTLRSNQLRTHLLARGYKEHLIDQQIQKAANTPRTETLQPHPPKQPLQRTPLVVTFHPCLSSLPKIVKKHLPILHTSRKLEKAIPNPPLVSFRRPRNLKTLLIRTRVSTPAPPTNIRTRKLDKPVAAHLCQSDHSAEDLEVRGIEKISMRTTVSGENTEKAIGSSH